MNKEHLAILKEGVEAWNKWREENPNVEPDLSEADLSGANLSEINFSRANLHKAILFDTNLTKADLSKANLSRTWLVGAKLIEADLGGADLHGDTKLALIDLSGANLRDADLTHTDFRNADLSAVDLEGVHLRTAIGIRLDGHDLTDVRFSPGAKDAWSRLRRTYSGPRYALHLIFLIAFLIPYIAKSLMWVGVTNTQQVMIDMQATIQQAAESVADSTYQPLAVALETAAERLAAYVPCEETGWKQYRVAQLLVGWDKNWLQVVLVFVLLLYNALRGFLTFKVSLLREEEERSHYSPYLKEYWRLYQAHWVVQVLLYVALGSFVYHAWLWLTQEVWLPPWL